LIFEVSGGHGIAHTTRCCSLLALALQSGFWAGSSLSHVIVHVPKPFVASSAVMDGLFPTDHASTQS
jgi:hypothetical protein